MYYYEKHDGIFVLMHSDREPYIIGPVVAIAFSQSSGTFFYGLHTVMLKHGKPESIEQWFQTASKAYHEAGFQKEADELRILYFDGDVEDLNKIIDITGYLEVLLSRNPQTSEIRSLKQ